MYEDLGHAEVVKLELHQDSSQVRLPIQDTHPQNHCLPASIGHDGWLPAPARIHELSLIAPVRALI